MLHGRDLLLAAALMLTAGCATLQEMPPPSAGSSSVCENASETGIAQQIALCDLVRDIGTRAGEYLGHHHDVSNERTALQGLTIVSALAGGAFSAFDAHDDNIEAAGLIAAGGLLVDRGLNMRARSDILRSGVLSMNCFAAVGNTFAMAYSAHSAQGQPLVVAYELDTVLSSLSTSLVSARVILASPAAAGDEQAAERAALTQAIARAETALSDLTKAQRAFRRIESELDVAWRAADADIIKRLDGTRPDLAALVREAQQLSAGLETPAGGAGATQTGGQRGAVRATDLSTAAGALNTLVLQAERVDPGRYIAAYERIAQCKALAAA